MQLQQTIRGKHHAAHHASRSASGSRGQLLVLFAIILYTPLPLASDRPWALALLAMMAGGLLLWNVWRPSGRTMLQAWQCAKVPIVLLAVWMLLLVVQLMPLPALWIGALDQRLLNGFVESDVGNVPISLDLYSTRLYLAKACVFSAIFWMVITLVNSRHRLEWLAKAIVLSGLLQAIAGIILMATGTTFEMFFVSMANVRGHGTFVSPNNFAGYLELTLAIGVGLMIAKLDGRQSENWRQRLHGWLALLFSEKILLRVALIIMVVGLVASRSRMGNAAFFASLLLTGVFTVIFSKHAARTTVIFIASLIVLDVVIIGGVVGVEKVVQRIENTNVQESTKVKHVDVVHPVMIEEKVLQELSPEESVEERTRAARSSLGIVRDFPWLGVGGGTFHLILPHYKPMNLLPGFWDHAHNDYVEIASEVGLVGFLLMMMLVLSSLWRSLKLLRGSSDQLRLGMAFASLMGVVSLLIHAAVDFNFQNPANSLLFLILLSFPYLLSKTSGKSENSDLPVCKFGV